MTSTFVAMLKPWVSPVNQLADSRSGFMDTFFLIHLANGHTELEDKYGQCAWNVFMSLKLTV